MNFLNNRAVKQLVDSIDEAAIVDIIGARVAKFNESGKTIDFITYAITPVLKSYGFTLSEIDAFVLDHLQDNADKYDGYGPNGFEENTGFLYMTVSCNKNAEEKVVRTVSVGFNTTIGQSQNFDVPQKVTVTEI